MGTAWEEFLRGHFPGYLLPESQRQRIDAADAARFLERLTGRPQQLRLLLTASLLAANMDALRELALEQLPQLIRTLTARTEVHPRLWEGGYQGRLDVRATLARHLAGEPTRFVTRARRRRFDLPEQVLVRATVKRLIDVLAELRAARITESYGWSADASDCEARLRHLLESTVLREVPQERPGAFHLRAAELARHPCYGLARWWHLQLEQLRTEDPVRLARILSEGALSPMNDYTRFELAVAIRLLQCLEARLEVRQPGRWTLQRTLVMHGRTELAVLVRDDGARVRLFYNQAVLGPGAVEAGSRHYLGHNGRMRPDLTLKVSLPGGKERGAVVEIKHSAEPGTLLAGFHEANLYRLEYATWMSGWPQAVLVASGTVAGVPRREDDVIAVDWARWVPDDVVDGFLDGL
ncbi:hypothetical protein JYK02_10785 [Corallococcus macrosporus]|uniref:DUF2357 domain-containing protein n=1 Tax=Corallococcus macrosporus TaxID=35 RepID=A0ABS3D8K1_9BACT|nr:hypothetical protein [Corallococcus macrosporus]MBN8227993.1 hypothetical protein [Corallococcus macrosporus]